MAQEREADLVRRQIENVRLANPLPAIGFDIRVTTTVPRISVRRNDKKPKLVTESVNQAGDTLDRPAGLVTGKVVGTECQYDHRACP